MIDRDQLLVRFCRGTVRSESGAEISATWAETPFGFSWIADRPGAEIRTMTPDRIVTRVEVTTVDLYGADRESVEAVASEILRRGLLAKPGIAGKGEAVLFVLVNEALHEMERIAAKESRDA